jgi:hypothetical protein
MVSTNHPEPWSAARLRREFISPELVSGLVLVSVVIAVAQKAEGFDEVYGITVLSVLVIWVTEVFVHTVAGQRVRGDDDAIALKKSFRRAVRHARGYLFAAVPPLVLLTIGLFGGNDGAIAYVAALWCQVALLGVVGFIAFGGRSIAWYLRLAGAGATAALGLFAILLKVVTH